MVLFSKNIRKALTIGLGFALFFSFNVNAADVNPKTLNEPVTYNKKEQTESWGQIRKNLATQALRTMRKYNLTTESTKCLIFQTDDKIIEGRYIVDILEQHGNGCSGDPATQPRLFSVEIEKVTGAIWTDGLSDSHEMQKVENKPLPYKKKSKIN